MAELPRYKAPRPTPQTGGGIAQRAKAQMFGTLADRIDVFAGIAIDRYAKETEVQAKQDAEQAFAQRGMQAKVNEEMTVYGQTYTNALNNMHKKQLAIDTGVKFEETYNKFKNNPVAFKEATDEMYNKTSELLPDRLKAEYAIDFEANKAHFAGQVNNNRIKLDKEKDLALTNELFLLSTQNASKASREGNFDLALYEMDKGEKALKSSLEAGTITAEQHRKGVADIKFASSTAMFKGINDKHIQDGDLQGSNDYIESFRTSDVEGYTDEQREKLADEMQRDLNAEVKSNKADKVDYKERANLVIKKVNEIRAIGKEPPAALVKEAEALKPYASLSKQDEYEVQDEAYEFMKKFDDKTIAEKEAIYAELESVDIIDSAAVKVRDAIKKNIAFTKSMAKKDPQTLSVMRGDSKPLVPMGVADGFPGILRELGNRAKNQTKNKIEYGKNATQLFTDGEASEWSAYLESADTPISEKIDFIEMIVTTAPTKVDAVMQQLRKKGASVFTYTASLTVEGKEDIAVGVLRGQELLRTIGNQDYIKEFRKTILSKVGNAFVKGNADDMKSLVDSSLAYSVFLAEQRGDITDLKGKQERSVLSDITNGLHSINRQDFFLPDNTTKDEFEEWRDETLSPEDFKNVAGMTPDQALLFIRGNRVRITSVGNNRYAFYDTMGNVLQDSNKNPIILEK
jgi:hypothetical protein